MGNLSKLEFGKWAHRERVAHRCIGCGQVWVNFDRLYCLACEKGNWGFYDKEYAQGDGDLKVYEGE